MAVTQVEILDAMKKATEPKDWAVSYRSAESLREEGYDKVAKGDFMGVLDVIGASLFQAENGSYYSWNGKLSNELLGVKDDLYQSVGEFVKAQAAKQ